MNFSNRLLPIAAGGAWLAAVAAVAADTITFDELGPQPCDFAQTMPLTDEYAARGVTFEGRQPGEGGAILDGCSGFGAQPRSGDNFLAFDIFSSYATLPEFVYFAGGATRVECYATSPMNGAFILTAYDGANNVVDMADVTLVAGTWSRIEVSGAIDHVRMSSISFLVAVDDLSWEAPGGYRLEVTGQCPGAVTVSWSGATPGRRQGLVYGDLPGSTTIPGGPCRGTVLGIQGRVQLVRVFGTGDGAGSVLGIISAGCGGQLQLVETSSCDTSNVAAIP
ncbi:MAG: hypothetical protein IT430_20195 [Phycisphaerales bacterium]|nr:hypothetical protein [Phycisphaerales bacterium]